MVTPSLLLIPYLVALAAPTADEMAEARRFAAAKFGGAREPPRLQPGLTVVANHGSVYKNARGGRPLRIVDAQYTRGLYCHAVSKITVRLPGPGNTFTAVAGIDSNEQTRSGRGSVVFWVKVAEKEVFRSDVAREGMAGVLVKVELDGVTEFNLGVDDGRDGIACDQADWADAQVTLADGNALWLADLPMLQLQRGPYTTDPSFSFTYGGQPSAELLKDWQLNRDSKKLDGQRIEHTLAYTDPKTGLVVRCVAIEYLDFPTLEWTVYLKQTGQADSPILENILAMDLRLDRGLESEFVLHHNRGDFCAPDSYEPIETILASKSERRFAPAGGRPTNGQWPYYNIQWGGEGVIAVIGWPGQWAASFTRDEGSGLRLRGGQELTRFTLHPGEEVRTPLAVLQFWKGDRADAQNVWRRWMLAHNLPRPGGKLPPPIFTSCSGGFFPGLKCNEADELKFIDAYTREGIRLDYWWMDAGWYPCDAWPAVGTWEPDRERFPRGLKAVSDHARARGIGLIVWFEPERVAAGTWIAEQHPEWVHGGRSGGLLDLGNPAARQWLTEHIDRLLTEQGIDLYRQDFNIDPLPFWRNRDTENRQGITEIRHVEGYLAYWDELRRRHPAMLIDSCASGGRRNDLETLRRAVPLLRSDYQSFEGDPGYAPGNQCHTYALAAWLPYYGHGVYYRDDELVYNVRSHFCPALGFCYDVRKPGVDLPDFPTGFFMTFPSQRRLPSRCSGS